MIHRHPIIDKHERFDQYPSTPFFFFENKEIFYFIYIDSHLAMSLLRLDSYGPYLCGCNAKWQRKAKGECRDERVDFILILNGREDPKLEKEN